LTFFLRDLSTVSAQLAQVIPRMGISIFSVFFAIGNTVVQA
jgi:hypothetical protein